MSEYICPNCKKPIYDPDALLCHFCGGSLGRAGKGFLGRVRYSNRANYAVNPTTQTFNMRAPNVATEIETQRNAQLARNAPIHQSMSQDERKLTRIQAIFNVGPPRDGVGDSK
jgi:hypothetical protein